MPPNMILQSINFLKVSSGRRSDRGAAMNGRRKGTLVLGAGGQEGESRRDVKLAALLFMSPLEVESSGTDTANLYE